APTQAAHEAQVFTAVGVRRAFSPSRAFWSERSDGLLFLFHLHGFAELPRALEGPDRSCALPFWSTVLTNWLDLFGCPELPAWHPYPTSVRVIAWSVALSTDAWDGVLRRRAVESLWRQAHYCVDPSSTTSGATTCSRTLRHSLSPAPASLTPATCSIELSDFWSTNFRASFSPTAGTRSAAPPTIVRRFTIYDRWRSCSTVWGSRHPRCSCRPSTMPRPGRKLSLGLTSSCRFSTTHGRGNRWPYAPRRT